MQLPTQAPAAHGTTFIGKEPEQESGVHASIQRLSRAAPKLLQSAQAICVTHLEASIHDDRDKLRSWMQSIWRKCDPDSDEVSEQAIDLQQDSHAKHRARQLAQFVALLDEVSPLLREVAPLAAGMIDSSGVRVGGWHEASACELLLNLCETIRAIEVNDALGAFEAGLWGILTSSERELTDPSIKTLWDKLRVLVRTELGELLRAVPEPPRSPFLEEAIHVSGSTEQPTKPPREQHEDSDELVPISEAARRVGFSNSAVRGWTRRSETKRLEVHRDGQGVALVRMRDVRFEADRKAACNPLSRDH